jgi:hypothetical protein
MAGPTFGAALEFASFARSPLPRLFCVTLCLLCICLQRSAHTLGRLFGCHFFVVWHIVPLLITNHTISHLAEKWVNEKWTNNIIPCYFWLSPIAATQEKQIKNTN